MVVTHTVGIAEVRVARPPDALRTLIGSCVAVVLCDWHAKLGGMAHVMLPSAAEPDGSRGKYADTGVDWLLDEVLRAGATRSRLVAKLAGGAAVLGPRVSLDVGQRNIEAVRRRLAKHSIPIAGSDLGGKQGRTVLFDPSTGMMQVKRFGTDVAAL